MHPSASSWDLLYRQTPLCDVPRHFAGIRQSQFMLRYLSTILDLCPPGGRTLETGIGSGYSSIWLSLRGVCAEGIDNAPGIVERANQVNNVLGGNAWFRTGDLFQLYRPPAPRYHVLHHQGVLEHFTAPQIRAALAQQVALSEWVVFSVPSVYYPFEPEFGDERLLPLEEWQWLLSPFEVAELTYYGDPQNGEKEHILCVLRGQEATAELKKLMFPPDPPYLPGISAIVHTRNEARHIAACLETLRDWTDEIIVCDMESEDETVAIARQVADTVIAHPRIPHFDRARNVSAMRAKHRNVFYLDADERVPEELGRRLRELAMSEPASFSAIYPPVIFRVILVQTFRPSWSNHFRPRSSHSPHGEHLRVAFFPIQDWEGGYAPKEKGHLANPTTFAPSPSPSHRTTDPPGYRTGTRYHPPLQTVGQAA